MLTKTQKIDQITADNFGNIMWREVTEILEDDVQISQKYHRSSISPGASLDNVPPQVALIAQATWTPENIAPVTAKVVEAIAEQQAAIDTAAAKKLEAEAAAAKEVEDAKVREATALAAKESAVKAEAEAKAAADAAEAENKRLAEALAVAEAAKLAAAEQAKFDAAVEAAVAAKVTP